MTVSSHVTLPNMDSLKRLCQEYGVVELALFGSVLREDFSPESDIDVLVEFGPDAPGGVFAFVRLQNELSDLFGRSVDLVPKDTLKPLIRYNVLDSAQVIYAN